ncbi:hypothetical protein WR25_18884 isoform B [Diploscapter pachys]|uniref:Phospholipase A2 domain-containing protein n=1 Tax=Diploscapter pachys TaxID=2018661 RepID=A0A2A2KH36_9BILA|nr:hypothetical protein WR25_18884 isoform A [Diploscapter pachys]PAV73304.1 hypothetical protein WR25_18884 isoform B [Diploscapter pachys]
MASPSLLPLIGVCLLVAPLICNPVRPKIHSGEVHTKPKHPKSKYKPIELKDTQGRAWECGTSEWTKMLSKAEVEAKCPDKSVAINNCCLTHDKCYTDQLGQEHCDDNFCNCLEKGTVNSGKCHNETAPMFCGLVKTFGTDPYKASAPNATTPETEYQEEENDKPDDDYYDLTAKEENSGSSAN